MSTFPIDICLLGQSFTIECPKEQKDKLLKSAEYLNEKLQTLRPTAGTSNMERLAILVALKMSYEMLFEKPQEQLNNLIPHVDAIIDKLNLVAPQENSC